MPRLLSYTVQAVLSSQHRSIRSSTRAFSFDYVAVDCGLAWGSRFRLWMPLYQPSSNRSPTFEEFRTWFPVFDILANSPSRLSLTKTRATIWSKCSRFRVAAGDPLTPKCVVGSPLRAKSPLLLFPNLPPSPLNLESSQKSHIRPSISNAAWE